MPPTPIPSQDILDQLAQMRRELNELRARNLQNAGVPEGGLTVSGSGAFRVIDADGDEVVFIGGLTGDQVRPDGQPQRVVLFRDDNGVTRFSIWDPAPTDGDGYQQQTTLYDHLGGEVFRTDVNGGLAEPWLQIPLYPKYTMAAGSVYNYLNFPVAAAASEVTIWEGRMVMCTHPRLLCQGVWGASSGTNTTTYRIWVEGTLIGAWSASTLRTSVEGEWDIGTNFLHQTHLQVRLTAQSSGTGNVACQPYSLIMSNSVVH